MWRSEQHAWGERAEAHAPCQMSGHHAVHTPALRRPSPRRRSRCRAQRAPAWRRGSSDGLICSCMHAMRRVSIAGGSQTLPPSATLRHNHGVFQRCTRWCTGCSAPQRTRKHSTSTVRRVAGGGGRRAGVARSALQGLPWRHRPSRHPRPPASCDSFAARQES